MHQHPSTSPPQQQWKCVPLPPGVHTTTCMTCNRTCHENCAIPDNESKAECCAITNNLCTICPGKCFWDKHKNLPHRYEMYSEQVTVKSQDLYQRYVTATSQKTQSEQVLQGMVEEFSTIQATVVNRISVVYNSLTELEKIALVPNPLGVADYIDLMIQSEQQEKKARF